MNTRYVLFVECSNCHSVVTEVIQGTSLCTACNTAHMGKYQKDMLRFIKSCNGWHGLAKDSFTQKVAKTLVNRGLIEVDEFNRFRAL